jgi:hypothetical protein
VEGLQAGLCTPLGEMFGGLDGKRPEFCVVHHELGAVQLWTSCVEMDAVFQDGQVPGGRVTFDDGYGHRGVELLFGSRGGVGVLSEQVGGIGGLTSPSLCPARLGFGRWRRPSGVVTIGRFHSG